MYRNDIIEGVANKSLKKYLDSIGQRDKELHINPVASVIKINSLILDRAT